MKIWIVGDIEYNSGKGSFILLKISVLVNA